MKRLIKFVMAVGAILLASSVVVPSAQADDIGDSYPNLCWVGEICFYRDYSNERFQRQFWWTANHGLQNWRDTYNNNWSGMYVQDDAVAINNGDTECHVWVGDLTSSGWRWEYYPMGGGKRNLGDLTTNRNDRHERC